jgi:hypothetical protein
VRLQPIACALPGLCSRHEGCVLPVGNSKHIPAVTDHRDSLRDGCFGAQDQAGGSACSLVGAALGAALGSAALGSAVTATNTAMAGHRQLSCWATKAFLFAAKTPRKGSGGVWRCV